MSCTDLFSKVAAGALALTMGGCAVLDSRTAGIPRQEVAAVPGMDKVAVVVDPCIREGIDARRAGDVSYLEVNQNLRAGRSVTNYKGWVLFSDASLAQRFAPLAGAALVGGALSGVGAGVGRAVAIGAGIVTGATLGEGIGKKARVEDLTSLAACRQWLDTQQPQPSSRSSGYYQQSGRPMYGTDLLGRPIMPH